jgi:hypothetical protein
VPEEGQSGIAYAWSKSFVRWYSSAQAERFNGRGLRIVSVSPGSIDTEIHRHPRRRPLLGRLEEQALGVARDRVAADAGERAARSAIDVVARLVGTGAAPRYGRRMGRRGATRCVHGHGYTQAKAMWTTSTTPLPVTGTMSTVCGCSEVATATPQTPTVPVGVQRHFAALSAPSAPADGSRLPTGHGRPLRGLERDHRGDDHGRRLNRRLGQDVSSKPRLITPNHHIGQLGWLKLAVPATVLRMWIMASACCRCLGPLGCEDPRRASSDARRSAR